MDVKLFIVGALVLCTDALHVNSERFSTHDILRRIEELEQRDRSQQAELDELRKQNLALDKEIHRLKERDVQHTRRIEVLEEQEQVMKKTIDVLMDELQQINEERPESQDYEGDQQPIDREDSQAKNKGVHKSSIGHTRIRQVEPGLTTAFFATLTNHAEHLGLNQVLVFDRVLTNIGQAYHSTSGVFTAPVSGVYVFSSTIRSFSETAHFQFVVNGQPMSNMNAHSSDTYETMSMTVIFSISKGDDVSIRNGDFNDKFAHGNHYSSFSGFLLSLDTVNPQIVG